MRKIKAKLVLLLLFSTICMPFIDLNVPLNETTNNFSSIEESDEKKDNYESLDENNIELQSSAVEYEDDEEWVINPTVWPSRYDYIAQPKRNWTFNEDYNPGLLQH